jgi:hypothetical protein
MRVDDPFAVGLVECVGDLDGTTECEIERQRSSCESIGQRLTFQVFHDQEVGAIVLSHVEHRTDVRMAQRGERLRLALESLLHIGTGSHVRWQDLDRDDAIQAGVARPVDLAHTACPKRSDDLERPEACARRQGHCGELLIR